MSAYWQYYDEDFSWDDSQTLGRPIQEATLTFFESRGHSRRSARGLFNSGYVYLDKFDIVIDRYYGGQLSSADNRTRFRGSDFDPSEGPSSRVPVESASSWTEVRETVDRHGRESRRELLFRGQLQHHSLDRSVPNPRFVIPGLGEPSLVPSLWRKMLASRRDRYPHFANLSLPEWSHIFYSTFDLEDIHRRHEEAHARGDYILTMADMEDCSDPVLAEFGKYRMDLTMHLDNRLSASLATLLQHYGLYSPVLDLTSSLDVAMFFATHRFVRTPRGCEYRFVGTNSRESVIYLLQQDREILTQVCSERELDRAKPVRPLRQECVIAPTNAYSVNLPADFLKAIIRLNFDAASYDGPSVGYLFPDESVDAFLRALKTLPDAGRHLTDFRPPSERQIADGAHPSAGSP